MIVLAGYVERRELGDVRLGEEEGRKGEGRERGGKKEREEEEGRKRRRTKRVIVEGRGRR